MPEPEYEDDYPDDDWDDGPASLEAGQIWRHCANPSITVEILNPKVIGGMVAIIASDNRTRTRISTINEVALRASYYISTPNYMDQELRPERIWINTYVTTGLGLPHSDPRGADTAHRVEKRAGRLCYQLIKEQSFHCVDGRLAEKLTP